MKNAEVRGIKIFRQESTSIPGGLHKFFPNIEGFWTEHCGFISVSRSDFENFKQLKQVHFYGHKITTLDADLFLSNPLIKHISFGGNPLNHVGLGIFDGLKNLQSLYLENANCITGANADNNRAGVLQIIKRLETACPPESFSTLDDSPKCSKQTDKEFEENVVKMSWKILELDYTISQLEDRVKHLEKEMKKALLTNVC